MSSPVPFSQQAQSIRDNLAAELAGETARRAAIVAAGNPPPATYSVLGKSVSWNDYVSMMGAQIKAWNEEALAAGADGGLFELRVRGYT